MAGGTGLVLDERMLAHDPGRGHPERPDRLRALQHHLGMASSLVHIAARAASEEELLLVHTPSLVSEIAATAGRQCVVLSLDLVDVSVRLLVCTPISRSVYGLRFF